MRRKQKGYSITSLAKEANVSIATISRVVNNQQGVSEDLRIKVRNLIEQKGYRPNSINSRLKHIAIISEMETFTIENFIARVLAGIEKYSFEQEIATSIIFVKSSSMEKYDLLKMLRARNCDGALFIFNSCFEDREIEELVESGISTMMISSRREIEGTGYIDIDSYDGGYTATQHLLELGHKELAFLAGPAFRDFDNKERIRGFECAVEEAEGEINSQVVDHLPTQLTQEAGYLQAMTAIRRNPNLTAIFANNDEMAQGAILACVDSGKRVPEDISVIGFDDCPFSQFLNPPLTTVNQPLTKIGYEAIKMLDLKLRGVIKELPQNIIKGKLITRRSTRTIN